MNAFPQKPDGVGRRIGDWFHGYGYLIDHIQPPTSRHRLSKSASSPENRHIRMVSDTIPTFPCLWHSSGPCFPLVGWMTCMRLPWKPTRFWLS